MSPDAARGLLMKHAERGVSASGRTVEVEMDPYLAPGALVPSLIASSRETPWGTPDSDLADQNEHEAASNTEKNLSVLAPPA